MWWGGYRPTKESLGQPLLMPTCSATGLKFWLSFRFFKHPLNGCMVMLFLQGGEAENQSYPQKTAVNQSARQQVKNWSVPLPQVQWGTTNVVLFKFIIVVRSLDRDYIFTGNSNCYFTPGCTDDLDVCPVRFLEERYGTRLNTGCLNCKYWVKTEKYAERL